MYKHTLSPTHLNLLGAIALLAGATLSMGMDQSLQPEKPEPVNKITGTHHPAPGMLAAAAGAGFGVRAAMPGPTLSAATHGTLEALMTSSVGWIARTHPDIRAQYEATGETGATRAGAGAGVPSAQAAGTAVGTAGTLSGLYNGPVGWAMLGIPGLARTILTGGVTAPELPAASQSNKK